MASGWGKKLLIALVVCIGFFIFGWMGIMALIFTKRSLRNNNPGSLIDNGIDWVGLATPRNDGYRHPNDPQLIFSVPRFGIRALIIDVAGDIYKDGLTTISKLVEVYAPRKDTRNDTDAYIKNVSTWLGLDKDAPLQPQHFVPLIHAIVRQENSFKLEQAYSATEIAAGFDLGLDYAKKHKNLPPTVAA